ncbi:MAG: hypothetical protein IPL53_06810 [Ignavibacteria bacterium]|nr:hypothetical protein [Ignavibacteria bacterium]
MDRVESSGGKFKSPKTQIAPGMGYNGVFLSQKETGLHCIRRNNLSSPGMNNH